MNCSPNVAASDSVAGANTLVIPASACGQKVTISGDNNSAHSDGEPTPSCQDSYGKTVWYQLVPEANGTITASTAGSTISGGDVFDTVLAAYEGTSSSLTERACNDDTGDTTSRISFSVSGGQKYYLQLGGYDSGDGGAHGTFQLCIALNNDGACSGPAEPTAVANQVIPTSTTGPTETPTPDWTATPTSASGTDTPTPIGTIAGTGTGTTTGTGNVTGSKSGTPIAQTAAGPGRAGAAGTGTGRGTAGAAGPGGSGAPGDVSLAPTQSVVSALTPSITWFQLPSGYQLSVTLDPAAIAALQAALPNVAQVLIVFDPAPSLLNDVQRGSLGGGNVTPAGLPFALTLVPKDSDGKTVTPVTLPAVAAADAYAQALTQVQVQLVHPVLPSEAAPDGVFAWLQAVYDSGGFQGYLRPAATYLAPGTTAGPATTFGPPDPLGLAGAIAYPASNAGANPPALKAAAGALDAAPESANPLGALRLRFSMADLQGTLFLPAALMPAYVANFDAQAHIYSSPFASATDYGLAGPQYTTFTVVAPQVASRLYVYDPVTDNYGWIDVQGVGPVPPPE